MKVQRRKRRQEKILDKKEKRKSGAEQGLHPKNPVRRKERNMR